MTAMSVAEAMSTLDQLMDSRPATSCESNDHDLKLSGPSEVVNHPPRVDQPPLVSGHRRHPTPKRHAAPETSAPETSVPETSAPETLASRKPTAQVHVEPQGVGPTLLAREIVQAVSALETEVAGFEAKRTLTPWAFRKLKGQLTVRRLSTRAEARTLCGLLHEIADSRDSRAVELISNWTCNASTEVRKVAAESLGLIGSAAAIQRLLPMLKDDSVSVQRAVVEALAKCSSPEVVRPLLALVLFRPQLRSWVMQTLKATADTSELVLRELVCQNQADLALAAVFPLGQIGGEQSERAILSARSHESAAMRAQVAEALGHVKAEKATSALNQLLQDPIAEVRERAAKSLVKTPSRRSRSPLLRAMRDSSPVVRKHAAIALGKLGDEYAVRVLVSQLNHSAPDVVEASVEALGEINGPAAAGPLVKLLRNDELDSQLKQKIVLALRGMKSDIIVPTLVERLKHSALEPKLRRKIVETLGLSEDPRATVPIEELLAEDPEEKVRAAAAKSLGHLKQSRSATALTAALNDEFSVRCAAVTSIGSLGIESLVTAILPTMQDLSFHIRYRATVALGRLGNEQVLQVLNVARDDSNELVQRAAERSIQEVNERCGLAQPSKLRRLVRKAGQMVPPWMWVAWPESRTGRSVLASVAVVLIAMLGIFSPSADSQTAAIRLPARSAIMTDNASKLIINRANGSLELWDVTSNQFLKIVRLNVGGHMIPAGHSNLEVVCARFKSVVFWDLANDESPSSDSPTADHKAPILRLVANSNSSYAVSMGTDGQVLLWNLRSKTKSAEFPLKITGMHHLALNENADKLVAADPSGVVVVHDVKSGKLIQRWMLPKPATSLGFSKDEKVFATDSAGTVTALEVGKPAMTPFYRDEQLRSIVVQSHGPNGKFAAFGLSGGAIAILNVSDRKTRLVEIPDCETTNALAFTDSGKRLTVTSGEDTKVWIIDVDAARLERTLPTATD